MYGLLAIFLHVGFQDSALAMQALVEYSKLDTNRALYNMQFTIQATSMGNNTQVVRLNKTNWATQQYVNVSRYQCNKSTSVLHAHCKDL